MTTKTDINFTLLKCGARRQDVITSTFKVGKFPLFLRKYKLHIYCSQLDIAEPICMENTKGIHAARIWKFRLNLSFPVYLVKRYLTLKFTKLTKDLTSEAIRIPCLCSSVETTSSVK